MLNLLLFLSLTSLRVAQGEEADELPPFPVHLFAPPPTGSGVVPLVDWASHVKLRLDSQLAGPGAKLAVHVWVDDGQRVAWTPGELADLYHFVDTVSNTTVQSVSVLCDGSFVLEAPDEGVEMSCGSMDGTSFYLERALPGSSWCSTEASSPPISIRDCDFVWVEGSADESSDGLFDAQCDVSIQAIGSQFVALVQHDVPWLRDVQVVDVAAVALGVHAGGVASLTATGPSAAPHVDLWSPACYASPYGDETWSVRTDGIPSIWSAPANTACERATSCVACAALEQCTWCSGGDGSCSTSTWCFGGMPFNAPEHCPTATMPSESPTLVPTFQPTPGPSPLPTVKPTTNPSPKPTLPTPNPTFPTPTPTQQPTPFPTHQPTSIPTPNPSHSPTSHPTPQPSAIPTAKPSPKPTYPTPKPAFPTPKPSPNPTRMPTTNPTANPTSRPTFNPTSLPTTHPTRVPTVLPTANPTAVPSPNPTADPTATPTLFPTQIPTAKPTQTPIPTSHPTPVPTHAPCTFMGGTIAHGGSEILRTTRYSTSSTCITCTVICTSAEAQLAADSDSNCHSYFENGSLHNGGCSTPAPPPTGGGGGGGGRGGCRFRRFKRCYEQKRNALALSSCSPINAALWSSLSLTVNVHPEETDVMLYSADFGGSSSGGSIAMRGASALFLKGVYHTMNVSVDSGATVNVDGTASIQGRLSLASTADAMVPPLLRLDSELEVGRQGALSLDGFGSFELAASGRLVVGDRERPDEALVRVIRREPTSATHIDLSGTVVWDRLEGENVLLVASVRQIGSGSISHATFEGVFSDVLNNTLVPVDVNGTGDEVKVALMYRASEDISIGPSAPSGRSSEAQSVGEGDYSVALVVAVVVLVLCASVCVGVAVRRKRSDSSVSAIDSTTVSGRAAEYYEPEMLQSHLVGVQVMGKGDDTPQARASRSSSRYFKPVAAPRDTGYEAPIVNRRGEHGYKTVAADEASRSRRSSLIRSKNGQSTPGHYGAVPVGLAGSQRPPPPPQPVMTSPVAAARYADHTQASSQSTFPTQTVAQNGQLTQQRAPPKNIVAPRSNARSRSGSSSHDATRRSSTRDTKHLSRKTILTQSIP